MLRLRISIPFTLLLLAGLGWGIERMIVTDAEAIETLVEDAADAFQAGAFERLAGYFCGGFKHGREDEAKALARAKKLHRTFKPVGTRAVVQNLVIDGDTAESELAVWVRVLSRVVPVRGRVTYARHDDGSWCIAGAQGFTVGPK